MRISTEIRSATFKLADAVLFDGVPQPWELPESHFDAPPIPSMICAHEQRFIRYLMRHHYTGAGTVVDMGPLFGSSTYALLSGMSNGCVHSYDLWQFCPDWENLLGRSMPAGADVYPVFAANLSSMISRVKPHKGDLLHQRWNRNPIEILFVDAAKSSDLMLHIANEFFPSLLPGAYVLQQDWVSFATPWIQIAMGLLERYFDVMDSPEGGTVCFRVKRRIPQGVLSPEYFHDRRAPEYLDRAADALSGRHGLFVRLSEAYYWALHGELQRALVIWKLVQGHRDYSPGIHGFDIASLARVLGVPSPVDGTPEFEMRAP